MDSPTDLVLALAVIALEFVTRLPCLDPEIF